VACYVVPRNGEDEFLKYSNLFCKSFLWDIRQRSGVIFDAYTCRAFTLVSRERYVFNLEEKTGRGGDR